MTNSYINNFSIFEQTFKRYKMIRYFLWSLILIVTLSSCRLNKELIYMQGIEEAGTEVFKAPQQLEYKVQKSDVLYIKLNGMDDEVVGMFNPSAGASQSYERFDQASMYFSGYMVSDSGFITLPVVGEVYVENMTTRTIEELLLSKTAAYVKDASIVVKLANFKLTVLGEVNQPGMYYLYQNKANLLDVLSLAGDLTDYGNRKTILIIRPTETGSETFRLDLTDKNTLISEHFYLKPNDIVYVEPLPSKGIRLVITDYGSILTAISSTLTAIALIITLTR